MNNVTKVFTIFSFLVSFNYLSAQVTTDYSDNPHRISFGYGLGFSNILEPSLGYCGSIELTLPYKNNCFLFGFNNVIGLPPNNPPISPYFFGGNSHEIRSYYICYGIPWRVKSTQMGVYGGLEAMSGYTQNLSHFNVIGLHADYACIRKLAKGLGVGADVFANYSLSYSDVGLRIFFCLTD